MINIPQVKTVKNETVTQLTREARVNQTTFTYTYVFKIIQHPKIARACGSGSKCKDILISS